MPPTCILQYHTPSLLPESAAPPLPLRLASFPLRLTSSTSPPRSPSPFLVGHRYADSVTILLTSLATSLLCELISYILIYRTPSYTSLKSSIDKSSKKLQTLNWSSDSAIEGDDARDDLGICQRTETETEVERGRVRRGTEIEVVEFDVFSFWVGRIWDETEMHRHCNFSFFSPETETEVGSKLVEVEVEVAMVFYGGGGGGVFLYVEFMMNLYVERVS